MAIRSGSWRGGTATDPALGSVLMVWTSLKRNSIRSISLSASHSFLMSTGDIVLLAAI